MNNDSKGGMSFDQPGWLVSFGDLITLLLCFFICLVSFSPINPANSSNTAVQGDNSESNNQHTDTEDSGTAIADTLPHSGKNKILLFEQDFAIETGSLVPSALLALKKGMVREGYEIDQAMISACGGKSVLNDDQAWRQAMSRVLAVRRQVFDGRTEELRLALRTVGGFCELLENDHNDEQQVAATIELTWSKKDNG